jgi:hypothetical protein
MGLKETKTLENTIEVQDAYGRVENVSGKKDKNMNVRFCWYASQDAANDKKPLVMEESFNITQERIAANDNLQLAYDEFIKQIYLELKTDEVKDATDAI